MCAIQNPFGFPWVLGADFEVTPEELQTQVGTVLGEADAYIVATTAKTLRRSKGTHLTFQPND